MDTKRMILAVAIVFVALVVAGFLIHAVWLGPTYQAMRDGGFSFRAPDALQHRLWLIWFGDLLYAILFVWVYNRGREEKPWVGQGLRYGVLMTLFTIVPSSLTEYAVYQSSARAGGQMDGGWRLSAGDARVARCGSLPEEDRLKGAGF